MANNGIRHESPEKRAHFINNCDANNGPITRSKSNPDLVPKDYYLRDLNNQLHHLVNSKPSERAQLMEDDAEDPAASPIFWISKWVDYTDKYGLGYQLCDNSVGVLFNDITKIVLLADETNMHYIERDGTERYHKFDACPQELYKKLTLLKYFRNYMNEHLLKTGDKPKPRDGDDLVRLPHLNNWFRTRNAIVFQLTNGTVQVLH
jgi:polo-like kinase 1